MAFRPCSALGSLWLFCSGFSPVLCPFRYFACRLVHSVVHPWIAAVWRPCLALSCCFCESVFRGGNFFDRIDKIDGFNKMAGFPRGRMPV